MKNYDCAIVGGGFTGMAAAHFLAKKGLSVVLLEAEEHLGGLAAGFRFRDGIEADRFYHHWFLSDRHIIKFVEDMGLGDRIHTAPVHTGSFVGKRFWRLSSPLDLLRFRHLSFFSRIRLGLAVILVKTTRFSNRLAEMTVREWLEPLAGSEAFNAVWLPLLEKKFGIYSEQISAAWMWKKLSLRGLSRSKGGRERLVYFRGGFSSLNDYIDKFLLSQGVSVEKGQRISALDSHGGQVRAIFTEEGKSYEARTFLFAVPPPALKKILGASRVDKPDERDHPYLSNICLVLRLDRNLSNVYWTNVSDSDFPFVGVIQHNNLDDQSNFSGNSIVYLSEYTSLTSPQYQLSDDQYLLRALPFLKKIYSDFDKTWIIESAVWRADYAHPLPTTDFYAKMPPLQTAFSNTLSASMAQIFPEDRGTNYAVRDGTKAAEAIHTLLSTSEADK